jgi:peptide/nickel transport system substrate-binding protein
MKIAPQHTQGAVDLSRRRFLQITTFGLAVVSTGGLLSSCSSDATSPSDKGASGKPQKGGTLRVGSTGGGTTDTLDPQAWATLPDQLRVQQLYDPLVWMGADGKPELVLAKEITPNADGTEWTITIQEGVTTHAGKPFTADDVLFSFQRVLDNKFPGAFLLGPIDLKSSKAVDATTVSVKFSKPYGILRDTLSFPYFYMVPRGFDPANPDGTGPFKFKSFTPGEESTFVRNENYWQSGLPYLDSVVIQNITDESSQMSAFQAGQVDIINALSAGSVAALKGGGNTVKVNESGNWVPFTMNCQADPFSDPKVRQAFRLIPDRKQMLEQVFGGYGSIGNDVFSPYDPGFPSDLEQREQDLDQAKSLLASAGVDGLQVELFTGEDIGSVAPAAATLFVGQAKKAGVDVKVVKKNPFYGDDYLSYPFAQDFWNTRNYLPQAAVGVLKGGTYNETHWDKSESYAKYAGLIASAQREIDEAKRNSLLQDAQKIEYDEGGYIIWGFRTQVDAVSQKVQGLKPSKFQPLGNYDFKTVSISS